VSKNYEEVTAYTLNTSPMVRKTTTADQAIESRSHSILTVGKEGYLLERREVARLSSECPGVKGRMLAEERGSPADVQ